MENNETSNLPFDRSNPIAQKQLALSGCFGIVIAYIFVMVFVQSIVSAIYPNLASVIQMDGTPAYVGVTGKLLSQFLGLLAAAYFAFLMIRKYFPARTINLSLSQIGLRGCSNIYAALAIILGIIFAIIFEYFLPRRYPADPLLLENMSSRMLEASAWGKIFLLLITVGITPIVEETFFRGFLYKVFSGRLGKLTGALLVTMIFVTLHYQVFSYWVALFSLLVGSVTLMLIREVSVSLIPPILLHQFYNLGVAIFQ